MRVLKLRNNCRTGHFTHVQTRPKMITKSKITQGRKSAEYITLRKKSISSKTKRRPCCLPPSVVQYCTTNHWDVNVFCNGNEQDNLSSWFAVQWNQEALNRMEQHTVQTESTFSYIQIASAWDHCKIEQQMSSEDTVGINLGKVHYYMCSRYLSYFAKRIYIFLSYFKILVSLGKQKHYEFSRQNAGFVQRICISPQDIFSKAEALYIQFLGTKSRSSTNL